MSASSGPKRVLPHLDDVVAAAEAQHRMMVPLEFGANDEPVHGSVVLVNSTTGTAAQRFYNDGLWHFTTGEVCNWERLFLRYDGRTREVYLLWEAPDTGFLDVTDADGPE